jgi:hypothetical protein
VSQAKSNRWVVDPGAWPPVMSAQRNPISNIHALRMAYVETAGLEALLKASSSYVLGIVHHDRRCGRVPCLSSITGSRESTAP